MSGVLFQYFERIEIIHLPERTDRFRLLRQELEFVGLNRKFDIPPAPKPTDADGFPSRGVYGNFLSHLDILQRAEKDGLESVLILEDDAIFSSQFNIYQSVIASALSNNAWDKCYIGHSIRSGLPISKSGLVEVKGDFLWAHCYAVHKRILPSLVDYLLQVSARPSGHPNGGKMYIDAAYTHFRQKMKDRTFLVTSPCMSVQRGSRSSLVLSQESRSNSGKLIEALRRVRDYAWRRGLISLGPKDDVMTRVRAARPWPK